MAFSLSGKSWLNLLLPGAAAFVFLGDGSCPAANIPSPPTPTVVGDPYSATITFERGQGRPVNRLVLGTNFQWADRGDQLMQPGSTSFEPQMLKRLFELGPTAIRYPGGSQGDTYHWKQGVGPLNQRQGNELFYQHKKTEPILYGTEEFLRLVETLGAEPIRTVNLASGTPDEAADWVRATNVTRFRKPSGALLPKVRYWEIDNEPYLKQDGRPEFYISASEYARNANAAIKAMRAVDGNILLGIPLRSDTLGTISLPQQTPRFAETVLREVSAPFDFVSLHNAYFPFIWNAKARDSDEDVFRALMAAPRVVEADMAHVRTLLSRLKPGRRIGISVTEYNALFSFGGARDGYIATLGAALYVADLLRLFEETDDLVMANHWSGASNWYFGAISNQLPSSREPEPRPAFHVFRAYDEILRGRLQRISVSAPTFSSKEIGLVPAMTATPVLTALATIEGVTRRMIVINKDPTRPVDLTIAGLGNGVTSINVRQLSGDALFDVGNARKNIAWRPVDSHSVTFPLALRLPPHSIGWIEIRGGVER